MDLRKQETELLKEFYEGCKRLLEIDGQLMGLHSEFVQAGQQGREPFARADILRAAKDLVTREDARRRRVAGTTKTQPNRRKRPKQVYKLKR